MAAFLPGQLRQTLNATDQRARTQAGTRVIAANRIIVRLPYSPNLIHVMSASAGKICAVPTFKRRYLSGRMAVQSEAIDLFG